jgi:outer membrane protein
VAIVCNATGLLPPSRCSLGRLSPKVLGLRMPVYDANVHYQQVRDTWAGVRTPNER